MLGVLYEEEMLEYSSWPHHQIAGNMGALFTATNKWRFPNHKRIEDIYKVVYEQQGTNTLFIDEKYKQYLTQDDITRILSDWKTQKIISKYSFPDEQFISDVDQIDFSGYGFDDPSYNIWQKYKRNIMYFIRLNWPKSADG